MRETATSHRPRTVVNSEEEEGGCIFMQIGLKRKKAKGLPRCTMRGGNRQSNYKFHFCLNKLLFETL